MRRVISLFLTLHLISSTVCASVEDTCKGVAAARPNIGYEFCMSSLQADPGSLSDDPCGLAVIAARLSIAGATRIGSKIQELMGVESDPSRKDCLSVCMEVYSDSIDSLSDAIVNLNSRRYREAVTFLSAALDASENCEDAFGEVGGASQSPLASEDGDYGRLADIALTITAALG